MRHADRRRSAALVPLLLAVIPSPASAVDVGEIAVVEDTGRQITQSAILGSTYVERAACAFYATHEDRYDALFIFSSIPMTMLTRTQQGWATRSAAKGIGRDIYPDRTSRFCATRLRHAVKMGDLGSFSDDPDATYTGAIDFTLSGVELMGHEFGHQWMSGSTFRGPDGQRHCYLRAFTPSGAEPAANPDCDGYLSSDFNQHWSYYFSTGSVMYGNTITDLGNGQFALTNPRAKYSELDQYLMGLRDPSEVAPMFVVNVGPPSAESSGFPVPRGQTVVISGERIDLDIQDIIAVDGPRVPSREPCHWKAAFVVLHEEGHPPTPSELAKVDAYRRRWEQFYAEATDHRGSFDTTLAGTGQGTPECPANGTPVIDAGVQQDATTADASSAPDAEAADAGTIASDASEPDATPASPEPGPRTLITEDCACTATSEAGKGSPLFVLGLLLALRARRIRNPR